MRHLRRFSVLAPAFILSACVLPVFAGDDGRHSHDDALFSAAEYLEHVGYLASDELEGRGNGQEGLEKAAEYIAEVFEGYGVQPAGDDGTYFQVFELKLKSTLGEDTRLAIGRKGRKSRRPARLHRDYVPFPFSKSGAFRGGVVFAGYGIVNEDLEYNDYKDIDVADKVVLMLRRAPEFGDFGLRDMAFRRKASRANARDAVAIMIVNPIGDKEGDKLFDFSMGSRGFMGFGRRDYGIPMLHITQRTAEKMLKAAGMPDLASLQQQIEDAEAPASAPLEGVSVKGFVDIGAVETPVRNVVGLIPGTGDDADEIIILGAHYDHLGINNKGDASFDPDRHISNGADDNASGTAMLLTLAEAYTQGAEPNRSLLLVAFAAEELGLIGSRNFVKEPTIDLDDCVAMLNFDMVGRLKNDHLEVGGMRTGGFENMIRRLAEPYGLKIKDGGGGRGPSDHTGFYQKDIPVLFFFTGIHKQYHKPTDDAHRINAEGAMRVGRLAADCIDEIDAMAEPPEFRKDDRSAIISFQRDDKKKDGAPARRRSRVRLGVRPEADDGPGVLVGVVRNNSPAARAGLKKGDHIIKLGDTPIDDLDDIRSALDKFKDGDKTTLSVRRGRKIVRLTVVFGKHDKPGVAGDRHHDTEEALAACAKRLMKAMDKPDAGRTVSLVRGRKSISLRIRSADDAECKNILEDLGDFIIQLPKKSALDVTLSVHMEMTLGGTCTTEIDIKLRRRESASDSQQKKRDG